MSTPSKTGGSSTPTSTNFSRPRSGDVKSPFEDVERASFHSGDSQLGPDSPGEEPKEIVFDREENKDEIANLPQIPTDAAPTPRFTKIQFSEDAVDARKNSYFPTAIAGQDSEFDRFQRSALARRKSSCVMANRRASTWTIEETEEIREVGRKRLSITRAIFAISYIIINGGLIALIWSFQQYWYIFVPFVLLSNALNSIMITNLIRHWIWSRLKRLLSKKEPDVRHKEPTTIGIVLPCYTEGYDEIVSTLDSIVEQTDIEQHKKLMIIICDGKVRGKGQPKRTDRILVEDILDKKAEEVFFPDAYESWDGAINGLYCSSGFYKGLPYVCLVKNHNLGKRDGLILCRTLLYKYASRHETPEAILGSEFFEWFCNLSESAGIEKFDWLVGIDADTILDPRCIYELHKYTLTDPRVLGTCGLVQVGFRNGNWTFWNLYQNAEYLRSQLLRRLHQSLGTGKVSCLPGACQIIRVCEESCGDEILITMFGALPDPRANVLQQVRALAGEDRNYICLILAKYPKMQTRLCMRAIAYTDPPDGLKVFLSQRRRWTLSTCANNILIVSKGTMNWFERICSTAELLTWMLPIFVLSTLALFIKACVNLTHPWLLLGFSSITIFPWFYAISTIFWGCKGVKRRIQYFLGLFLMLFLSQLMTAMVITYAAYHLNDFSWGKTRETEKEPTNEKGKDVAAEMV